MRRFRSIISRVVALHVIAIGVTSILMPLALYWLLNQAANAHGMLEQTVRLFAAKA